MFVLGVNLPERKLVRIALTRFVGIGHHTSNLICSRLQINRGLKVSELTEHQIGKISALLSSPSTSPPQNNSIASFKGIIAPSTIDYESPNHQTIDNSYLPSSSDPSDRFKLKTLSVEEDPLQNLIIESDLRREIRSNIAHHRSIGSYKGKRHALGFPVNGQRTHTNAKTAKKLNRIERRAYSTDNQPISNQLNLSSIFQSSESRP